jgi:hypothetical protein
MSFFKQNSNAKRMNELCFYVNSTINSSSILSDINNSNIKSNKITVRSNKLFTTINLDDNDVSILRFSKINNSTILSYYTELLLIKKALEYIFTDTEDEYHKYINLTLNCCNIYTINVLKEWLVKWYGTKGEYNEDENKSNRIIEEATNILPFDHELFTVYSYIKKCKVVVN